jgi:hypothetical protein
VNEEPAVTRVKVLLGAVPKSAILKPEPPSALADLHRRMIDVVCKSCGERMAMVTDESDEPWLTRWAPTFAARETTEGEPFWAVEVSSLPPAEEPTRRNPAASILLVPEIGSSSEQTEAAAIAPRWRCRIGAQRSDGASGLVPSRRMSRGVPTSTN